MKKQVKENIKTFLFTRWLVTSYGDVNLDSNMKSEHEHGYKKEDGLCCLNRVDGLWYIKKIQFFNSYVYPKYFKNGTIKKTIEFFIKNDL
jgi:hypothetical protein